MLCYRYRCFCNAPCKKQGVSCSSSFEYAVIEKSKSNEHFINTTIPVCGSDLSDVCFLFEPLDDEVNV